MTGIGRLRKQASGASGFLRRGAALLWLSLHLCTILRPLHLCTVLRRLPLHLCTILRLLHLHTVLRPLHLCTVYKRAKKLLKENREIMDKLAAHLIEKETITGKEFMKIYRKEKGIPEPAEEEESAAVKGDKKAEQPQQNGTQMFALL